MLTYGLLWDDNAVVYGASDAEQAKARTVKDYFGLLVSGAGQATLAGFDYSSVPNNSDKPLLTYAQNAVAAIDWNKRASRVIVDPPVNRDPVVTPPPSGGNARSGAARGAEQRLLDPVEQDGPRR